MPGLTSSSDVPDEPVELVVVGTGPAGVACALQARRDGLDVLAVSDEPIGGLVRAARRLDNLPGEAGVSGVQLAERIRDQLETEKVPCILAHVSSLQRRQPGFRVQLADGREVTTRTVCLATGTRPREWDLSTGGQMIHRDARSLPLTLAGQAVVLVGGGEAALDTALTCRDRGARVTVLVRGDAPHAVPRLEEECRRAGVSLRVQLAVQRVQGGPGGWTLALSDGDSVHADHLVVCIGRVPRDELARGVLPGGWGQDVAPAGARGILLAGDLIRGRDRYVATALGDGQRAAIAAAAFLKEEA